MFVSANSTANLTFFERVLVGVGSTTRCGLVVHLLLYAADRLLGKRVVASSPSTIADVSSLFSLSLSFSLTSHTRWWVGALGVLSAGSLCWRRLWTACRRRWRRTWRPRWTCRCSGCRGRSAPTPSTTCTDSSSPRGSRCETVPVTAVTAVTTVTNWSWWLWCNCNCNCN